MNEGPSNYTCQCECHNDEDIKHEGRCCFKCPKCHEQIAIYLFNQHKATCSKRNKLNKRPDPVNGTRRDRVDRQKIKRPPLFGSTRSRHKNRSPVGR